ncbi:MAG: hypothetical protein Kow0069_05490 [Promethearchaeota archaeon]
MNEREQKLLKILAAEFEYCQGLHVEAEKLRHLTGLSKDELETALRSLAGQGLVNLYEYRGSVKLAKISWRGLNVHGDVVLKFGLGKDYYADYWKEGYGGGS